VVGSAMDSTMDNVGGEVPGREAWPGIASASGTPASSPRPVPDAPSTDGTPSASRNTVQRHVDRLLGGREIYTLAEAAQIAGISTRLARRIWLSMGFPTIEDEDNDRVFADVDIESLRQHRDILESGLLTEESLTSLIRSESHMADRLVLWQHEALVEYAENELKLDGISARFWILDHFGDYEDFLRMQMNYAWRRHLASLLRRSEAEVSEMQLSSADDLQLQRAVGFVDMVAFTNRSNEIGSAELIELIETFEYTCRDVIASHGARVVKTIGDAFLFIADDVVVGAEVASSIVEELRQVPGMLPVRASLVWGGVVSRFGDIFGPTVNLASRLVDEADTGSVLTDRNTANLLRAVKPGRYTLVQAGSPDLQGIGRIEAVELRRMPAQ